MSNAEIPVRSVKNPTDPNSPQAMLRFFTELRERTGGDDDIVNVINQRVELLSNSMTSGQVHMSRRETALASARLKELWFLTYGSA
jgi:hypothetical protein